LQNILREASQPVPDALTKFGSTVKKKEHKLYGAYGPKEGEPMKSATKIVFGDD
jgi:ATP-dependent RNA helicase DBP3